MKKQKRTTKPKFNVENVKRLRRHFKLLTKTQRLRLRAHAKLLTPVLSDGEASKHYIVAGVGCPAVLATMRVVPYVANSSLTDDGWAGEDAVRAAWNRMHVLGGAEFDYERDRVNKKHSNLRDVLEASTQADIREAMRLA